MPAAVEVPLHSQDLVDADAPCDIALANAGDAVWLPKIASIGAVSMGRRVAVVAAAITVGLAGLGCMGGNVFGANPGDGGCGFRPDGLIVDDITGVWEGDGRRFTLKLDGVVTGRALLYEPQPGASPNPTASSRPRARTLPKNPIEVEATGRWTLKETTYLGDIDIVDVRSPRGEATFGVGSLYVSGTRREPFLYRLGDGDPDSCNIIKYERTSRG